MPELEQVIMELVKSQETISKGQEGIVLGLGSLVEALQKQYPGEEEEQEEPQKKLPKKDEEEDTEEEMKGFAKMIAKALVELQGNKPVSASGLKKPASDEGYKAPPARSQDTEVQRPIQAMEKAEVPMPDMEDEKRKKLLEEKEKGAEEYPMEEEKNKDLPYTEKSLTQKLEKALSEIAELKKALPNLVKAEADSRLRKLGFREEKASVVPTQVSLGATEVEVPIKKSFTKTEAIDELAKLSWSEINKLDVQSAAGDEGLPAELRR